MHNAVKLLKRIPKGRVTTYKELARVCRTSPRAVGRLMARNPDPLNYPCYKVVSVTGALCGYSGPKGLHGKAERLRADGVKIIKGRVNKQHFFKFN